MNSGFHHSQYFLGGAAAAMLVAALALGGCQSPLYSGTADDIGASRSVAPASDPSYVGRNETADEAPPADESPPAGEEQYEYRGGRDPATGRASTQIR